MSAAIAATREALANGAPGVLGVHIEGPFLNAARKGIHDATKFRVIDEAAIALLTSLKAGRTLVTLAPETTTPDIISRLTKAGVIVAAGHTNAGYATIRAALDHGLAGFTHLFNAMSPLTSRAPGAVGAALEDAASWCGLIVDGKHVDPVVLRVALAAKRHERFMLVTDAMPTRRHGREGLPAAGPADHRARRRLRRRRMAPWPAPISTWPRRCATR